MINLRVCSFALFSCSAFSGAITVAQRSELEILNMVVRGRVEVEEGAMLTMSSVTFEDDGCLAVDYHDVIELVDTPDLRCATENCGEIEQCAEIACVLRETGFPVAACVQCIEGYYSYRHDQAQGRCVPVETTIDLAGYPVAIGGVGTYEVHLSAFQPFCLPFNLSASQSGS